MRKTCVVSGLFLAGIAASAITYERAGGQVSAPQPAAGQPAPGGGITISAPVPGGGGASASSGNEKLVVPAVVHEGPGTYGLSGGFSGYGGEWTGPNEEMQELMQVDAEQEGQVQEAVNAYSDPSADSAARAEARNKLATALEMQFAARQQRREMEIQQIEERVKKLRDALDKRAAAKDKIIERRINDLLTEAEGLGWGDAGPGAGMPPGSGGRAGGGNPYGVGPSGGSPYGGGGRGEGRGRGPARVPSRETQPAPRTK